MEEFINLHQGGSSVLEYSFKFTNLSKYASSLVSNPRDEMNNFVMDLSDDLVEQCSSVMLHDNIDIYCILNKLRRVGLRVRIGSSRGQGPL